MTETAAEIIATHRIVWQYRDRLEHIWPTPGRQDALAFAFTEAGEAMDAHLRMIPQYARNNARNMNIEDELADCAMMLVTALSDTFYPFWLQGAAPKFDPRDVSLSGICIAVTDTLREGDVILPLAMIDAWFRLMRQSMSERVESRLQRIERKVTSAA